MRLPQSSYGFSEMSALAIVQLAEESLPEPSIQNFGLLMNLIDILGAKGSYFLS